MICAKYSCVTEAKSIRTSFQVSARAGSKVYNVYDARTVETMGLPTGNLIPETLIQAHPHLKGLPLPCLTNAEPKILIRLNNASLLSYYRIVENVEVENAPIAVKTKLGWCVYGKAEKRALNIGGLYHINGPQEAEDEHLHDSVKSFFTTESFGCKPIMNVSKSREEERVQDIVAKTLIKLPDRYTDRKNYYNFTKS
jgi:hypothetical protein